MGGLVTGLASGQGYVERDHDIAAFDVQTMTELGTMTRSATSRFSWLLTSPDGRLLYAIDDASSVVDVFDPFARRFLRSLPVSGTLPITMAVSADGGSLFVAYQVSNYVSVLDPVTGVERKRLTFDNFAAAGALAMSPNGRSLYAVVNGTGSTTGRLAVIDTATQTVSRTTPLGFKQSFGAAASPDGSRVYVSVAGDVDGAILVVDAATGSLIRQVDTDRSNPFQPVVTPSGGDVFVPVYDGIVAFDSTTFATRAVTNLNNVTALSLVRPSLPAFLSPDQATLRRPTAWYAVRRQG